MRKVFFLSDHHSIEFAKPVNKINSYHFSEAKKANTVRVQ